MHASTTAARQRSARTPWNLGKLIGQKPPGISPHAGKIGLRFALKELSDLGGHIQDPGAGWAA